MVELRSLVRAPANMFSAADALELVNAFDPGDDGLAAKSKDLTALLLRCTDAALSRDQYGPGHITGSALILNPAGNRILVMHHHRHQRWLLPGGHVEEGDETPDATARREAIEETGVMLADSIGPLSGIDVHGIPGRKGEPYHLHHDLIFAFRAESEEFTCSQEAPRIAWCGLGEFARFALPMNIVRSAERARLLITA